MAFVVFVFLLVFVLRVVVLPASLSVDLLPRWRVHWSIGFVEARERRDVLSLVFLGYFKEEDALEDQCIVLLCALRFVRFL